MNSNNANSARQLGPIPYYGPANPTNTSHGVANNNPHAYTFRPIVYRNGLHGLIPIMPLVRTHIGNQEHMPPPPPGCPTGPNTRLYTDQERMTEEAYHRSIGYVGIWVREHRGFGAPGARWGLVRVDPVKSAPGWRGRVWKSKI